MSLAPLAFWVVTPNPTHGLLPGLVWSTNWVPHKPHCPLLSSPQVLSQLHWATQSCQTSQPFFSRLWVHFIPFAQFPYPSPALTHDKSRCHLLLETLGSWISHLRASTTLCADLSIEPCAPSIGLLLEGRVCLGHCCVSSTYHSAWPTDAWSQDGMAKWTDRNLLCIFSLFFLPSLPVNHSTRVHCCLGERERG